MPTADEIRLALSLYGGELKAVYKSACGVIERKPIYNAEPWNKAIDNLLQAGLLDEVEPGKYEGNEALTMWVEALALVPFPVQRWTIPRFRLPDWDED